MDNLQNTGGTQPQLNINYADAPYIECEECKGKVFEEKMMIKKISKFMTGSDQDSIVPIPVIACADLCGCGALGGGAVAELTVFVETPAPESVVGFGSTSL